MPKRTRREKQLADKRHTYQTIPAPPSGDFSSAPSPNLSSSYSYTPSATPKILLRQSEDDTEYRIIKHDIVKTVILAVITIAIEFGLYFKFG